MRAIKRINTLNERKPNSHVGANIGETTQYQRRCARTLEKIRHDFFAINNNDPSENLPINRNYLFKRIELNRFYLLVCSRLTCDKGEVI